MRPVLTFVLVAVALLGSVTAAQGRAGARPPSDTLRARVLELVDESGQLRARLNVEDGGEVVLRLLDQEGTIRVKLGAGKDGSGLLLNNDATEPGVHLLAGRKGSSVRVANKDGRERVVTP
ncbi:MAG TPA: hypothetical protein VFT84_15805 [Gemmatimonadales bacterium]|nr:hypothetical protein [Gemmatimonadales bacterium]